MNGVFLFVSGVRVHVYGMCWRLSANKAIRDRWQAYLLVCPYSIKNYMFISGRCAQNKAHTNGRARAIMILSYAVCSLIQVNVGRIGRAYK